MSNLTDEKIKELQDKFLGKKIRYITWVGICEFLGYNSYFPSWELQLTIGRTPIQNVDYTKIELYSE